MLQGWSGPTPSSPAPLCILLPADRLPHPGTPTHRATQAYENLGRIGEVRRAPHRRAAARPLSGHSAAAARPAACLPSPARCPADSLFAACRPELVVTAAHLPCNLPTAQGTFGTVRIGRPEGTGARDRGGGGMPSRVHSRSHPCCCGCHTAAGYSQHRTVTCSVASSCRSGGSNFCPPLYRSECRCSSAATASRVRSWRSKSSRAALMARTRMRHRCDNVCAAAGGAAG